MADDLESKIEAARLNPQNLGAMPDADATGTVGSADCGDMLQMWVKFKTGDDGRKVIDKATFQSFGCQTAIAVASVATELLVGKTAQEALKLSPEELAAPLGALPPMKIHCAQLVEGALKQALDADAGKPGALAPVPSVALAPTLHDQLLSATASAKAPKIVFRPKTNQA